MFPNFFSHQQKNAVALELDLFEPRPVGKLLIGNRQSISRESLFANDVGMVVCCSEELYSACKTLPIQYNTRVTMVDPTFIAQLESPQLQEAMMFIAFGLNQHKSVLIFCESGLEKSAILTSFFLMKTYHISLAQAVNMIERAQAKRLRLNHALSQLAVDFEMNLFNRNSMIVDQGSLLVLPGFVPGVRVQPLPKRARTNPFNLLGLIMILFAVMIALIAQLPSQQRDQVLVDIQNLVDEPIVTDSGSSDESFVSSMVSSLFKVDERQEMFEKCKLSSASAAEFLQARDALRQVVSSFSDVYQKSYTDYHHGVLQYEKSSNLSSIYQQQLLILNVQEQNFAQLSQLIAAAETVQKLTQVEKQLDKLARERKALVKDRLSPLRDDYYRRVKGIVDTFPARNESLSQWILSSTALLQETQETLSTFVVSERQKMHEREKQYKEQVLLSQEELEEARGQLQTLINQSNQAMESLQKRLVGVQSDLEAMDNSLSEWTKVIDEAIAVASEGGEISPRHLPQHHHRDHPHLIQALRDEIEAIRRTSQLGQQVFNKEIDTHLARYEQALQQLNKLEQEKQQFEAKVALAKKQLQRWQVLLEYAHIEQQGFTIPYPDLLEVAQHLTVHQQQSCLNVMSLEVTATIATNALSTGALVTECTSRSIRDLQNHVLVVQADVEPKHQNYIYAKNEYLKIVEKKRRFNDTIEALLFQKESLVLQRKYQEAQRILIDIEDEKRSFETIDDDIARKEQFSAAAETVWHKAERELQRWISDLRVQVAQEQHTVYRTEILKPRLQAITQRNQLTNELQLQLQEAQQQISSLFVPPTSTSVVTAESTSTSSTSSGTDTSNDANVANEEDVVASLLSTIISTTIIDPMKQMYNAEEQHVHMLIDQLTKLTSLSSGIVVAAENP